MWVLAKYISCVIDCITNQMIREETTNQCGLVGLLRYAAVMLCVMRLYSLCHNSTIEVECNMF